MNVIARISKSIEARRSAKAALGEFARSYNGLYQKFYGRSYGIVGGMAVSGFPIMVFFMENTAGALSFIGQSVGFVSILGSAFWFTALAGTIPRRLRALSREFYSAAGIDRNPGFRGRLAPGSIVASFDHSFPDGRSGHVKVACDAEGYPLVFFTETAASIVLETPKVEALRASAAKQPLAIGAAV